jgi:ABC-type branched-subunit amino acid transport system substrate-binding protein
VGQGVHGTSAPAAALAGEVAEFAVGELLLRRLAVLYPDDAPGQALAQAFIARAQRAGARIVAIETFVAGETDFGAQLRRIAEGEPEGLFLAAQPEDLILITPQVRFYDIQAQLLGVGAWDTERLLAEASQFVEGAVFAVDRVDFASSRYRRQFEGRYRALYRMAPPPGAAKGYETARTLLRAIETGGLESREDEDAGPDALAMDGAVATSIAPPVGGATEETAGSEGGTDRPGSGGGSETSEETPPPPAHVRRRPEPFVPVAWSPDDQVSLLVIRSGQPVDLKAGRSGLVLP